MDGRTAPLVERLPARAFRARAARGPDARLAEVLSTIVDHLARVVAETGATRDDLRRLIGFLTEVGEHTSDQRQEWVLLADTLGLTSMVEAQSLRRPEGATPNTLIGPFWREGAPARADGESISIDGKGEPLVFAATVTDLDGLPVAGAVVEVWQANAEGLYENQEPDRQPEFNLRGTYRSGADGSVTIRSVRPGRYGVPKDGPVGRLLQALGLGLMRPAHLHFRVTAPGFQRLTTHVFDRADPALDCDPIFAVHPALATDFSRGDDGTLRAAYRFVLARARAGEESV